MTYAKDDRVRDTCWGGTFTGTVTKAQDGEDGSVFVIFGGTEWIENEMRPQDIEPLEAAP